MWMRWLALCVAKVGLCTAKACRSLMEICSGVSILHHLWQDLSVGIYSNSGIHTCQGIVVAFLFDDCKVVGLSPIRVEVGSFSTLIGFLIELGVLLAKWEGWEHIAKLHSLYKWVFEGVALQYLTFTPGWCCFQNWSTSENVDSGWSVALSSSFKPLWPCIASSVAILILMGYCSVNIVSASMAQCPSFTMIFLLMTCPGDLGRKCQIFYVGGLMEEHSGSLLSGWGACIIQRFD